MTIVPRGPAHPPCEAQQVHVGSAGSGLPRILRPLSVWNVSVAILVCLVAVRPAGVCVSEVVPLKLIPPAEPPAAPEAAKWNIKPEPRAAGSLAGGPMLCDVKRPWPCR